MNQQQPQRKNSRWIHPNFGILNLPIIAIVIACGFLRILFRWTVALNRFAYKLLSRAEQWALK